MILKCVKKILDALETNNIQYCHWKSNERLIEFVNGAGDLDLLFYPDAEEKVHKCLVSEGAKLFEALPIGKYISIKDYLVLDQETGILVHFHVHFGLDIGEKNVKRYSLPWVADVLDNRIKHEDVNVYTSSIEHEFLLLIIREVLRKPPHLIYLSRFNSITVNDSIQAEFDWLRSRVNYENLIEICNRLAPELKNFLSVLLDKGITKESILEIRSKLKPFRNKTKTKSSYSTEINILINYSVTISKKILNKIGVTLPRKRINPRGGSIIALIGADGSGKSTTIANISSLYNRKIHVETFYMGNPKVKSFIGAIVIKLLQKAKLYPFWNLYVKNKNIRKSEKLKNSGILVILDRFPQSKYSGIMDGPMFSKWHKSKIHILRWISKYEHNCFTKMEEFQLDILFKLSVSSKTSMMRGGLSKEAALKKTNISDVIEFPNAKYTYCIDTDINDKRKTKNIIINNIWKCIN